MKTVKRRRKENKTDYKKRLHLLKGETPRVVFRRTNRYFISQYIESKEAKDKVILTINSKDLLKHGWDEKAKGSLKSIPAAYFTGYLIGKQIISKKLPTPIVDLGMIRTLHKTKVFGFLKGLIDSGLEINCKEEAYPEKERIEGASLKNKIDFQKIKSGIDKIK